MLPKIQDIKTERLLLTPVHESITNEWINYPREAELVRMYGGNHKKICPKTPEEAAEWYRRLERSEYAWAIVLSGESIGVAKLTRYDCIEMSIYLSLGLFSEKFCGKGFGTEIVTALVTFCFRHLKLNAVKLEVLDFNERAIRCYEKAGFKTNATHRTSSVFSEDLTDLIMVIENHTI